MYGTLLALLILDGILLTVVVLLQAGKGGGLAAVGGGAGTDTFIGGRQAATLLTRTTWISGGIFLFLALVLSVMSSRQRQPESILRDEFQQTMPAPQPVLPGIQPETQPGEGAAEGGATTPPAQTPPQPEQETQRQP